MHVFLVLDSLTMATPFSSPRTATCVFTARRKRVTQVESWTLSLILSPLPYLRKNVERGVELTVMETVQAPVRLLHDAAGGGVEIVALMFLMLLFLLLLSHITLNASVIWPPEHGMVVIGIL